MRSAVIASLALPLVFVAAASADFSLGGQSVIDRSAYHIVAAAKGDGLAVAWEHGSGSLRETRVRADGTVLDVPARFLGPGSTPEIACSGARCLVVAVRNQAVEATLLNDDGAPLRHEVLGGLYFYLHNPPMTVAANDEGFLVTWQSGLFESSGAVLSRDGDVVSHFSLPRFVAASCGRGGEFALAMWSEVESTIYLFRVRRDGGVTAGTTVVTDYSLRSVALAASPSGFLLADSAGIYNVQLRERMLDATLQASGPETLLSRSVDERSRVSAVWDGSRYLVGYGELNSVYVVLPLGGAPLRFSASEAVLVMTGSGPFMAGRRNDASVAAFRLTSFASAPAPIIVGYAVAEQRSPALATNGRSALVTWYEGDGARAALLFFDGSRRDLDLDPHALSFNAAVDGSNYVVTWMSWSPRGLYAQRVAPDGTLLGPRRTFIDGTRAIWSGSGFVTVVERDSLVVARMEDGAGAELGELGQNSGLLDAVPDGGDVVFALSSSDGKTAAVQLVRFQRGAVVERTMIDATFGYSAAIASSGDGFLIAWNGSRAGITALRLDRHLVPTAKPIVLAPSQSGKVSAAWDGSGFVVAWESRGDIAAARVSASGESAAPEVLAASPDEESDPKIAAANGVLAFAYVRKVTDAPISGAGQIFVRFRGVVPPRRPAAPH